MSETISCAIHIVIEIVGCGAAALRDEARTRLHDASTTCALQQLDTSTTVSATGIRMIQVQASGSGESEWTATVDVCLAALNFQGLRSSLSAQARSLKLNVNHLPTPAGALRESQAVRTRLEHSALPRGTATARCHGTTQRWYSALKLVPT